jgi:hypothetical protein
MFLSGQANQEIARPEAPRCPTRAREVTEGRSERGMMVALLMTHHPRMTMTHAEIEV